MKRRDVLRNAGIAAGATVVAPGVVSAKSSDIEETKLSKGERKSFIGTVMSSDYYKSVRGRLKQDGFKLKPGKGISKHVRNTDKEESVKKLTVPGEHKREDREVEVLAVEDPEHNLNIVGIVTDPTSSGHPWVAHYISNGDVYTDTEDGYYSVFQEDNE